jgi:2-C-methyl-D-erythritol 4-phosphate cytidylyltransferase/2-C-methyl-D-erythritol 2,4-cyclodiphosphate synthase
MGLINELVIVFPGNSDTKENWNLRCPVKIARGGALRSGSVLNGLKAASSEFVLIHDAARPFLSLDICEALMEKTTAEQGVIPLLQSVDSLKEVNDGIITVVPRDRIFRTQTPQSFRREDLLQVLESSSGHATDEATLWLAAAKKLEYIPGDEKNFKITTDFDWVIAKLFVYESRETRTGFGYDIHELVPGRRLVLGGVDIPSPLGLSGHSDADVICHAISDALLGAAGLGDIGTFFPASDDRYRDIDSTILLEQVLELLTKDGWSVTWIDVTLAAQVPRLGAAIPKISDNLGQRFTIYKLIGKISIKVKSGEFIGGVGRGECMTCHAVAVIDRFNAQGI